MDFNERKNRVLAAGTSERGEYSPSAGSIPARAYNYYVSKGGSVPLQENFCHFWRVVVIWAPLFWFYFNAVEPVVDSRAAGVGARVLATPFALVHKGYTSLGTRQSRKKFWENTGWVVLGLILLAALVALGTVAYFNFLAFLAGMGIFLGIIAFVFGMLYLGDLVTRKSRAEKEERRRAFINGDLSYEDYFGPRRAPKEPSKVKLFFRHLGDFFVLVGNIIRVKKWKICPLVEVPKA